MTMHELLADSTGATGSFDTETTLAHCRKFRGKSAR